MEDALTAVKFVQLSGEVLDNILDMRNFVLKAFVDTMAAGTLTPEHFQAGLACVMSIHELPGLSDHRPMDNVEHHTIVEVMERSVALHFILNQTGKQDFANLPANKCETWYTDLQAKIHDFREVPFVKKTGPSISNGCQPRRMVDFVAEQIVACDSVAAGLLRLTIRKYTEDFGHLL